METVMDKEEPFKVLMKEETVFLDGERLDESPMRGAESRVVAESF